MKKRMVEGKIVIVWIESVRKKSDWSKIFLCNHFKQKNRKRHFFLFIQGWKKFFFFMNYISFAWWNINVKCNSEDDYLKKNEKKNIFKAKKKNAFNWWNTWINIRIFLFILFDWNTNNKIWNLFLRSSTFFMIKFEFEIKLFLKI